MADAVTSRRRVHVAQYVCAAATALLAIISAAVGAPLYQSLIVAVIAAVFFLGRRRIFLQAVSRSQDEIVCSYIPWYEGNAYILNVGLPVLGIASVGTGLTPGNPGWLLFTGVLLLSLTPIFTLAAIRMWKRCFLRISTSALTIQLADNQLTAIERRQVESIRPSNAGGNSPQIEISYRAVDSSKDPIKKILLGLQLTVEPVDLFNALVTWKDASDTGPAELLDRVETLLRGHSTGDA